MRNTLRFLPLLIVFCTMTHLAQARPASWHWWSSKVDGARICMQTSPGEGWQYSKGPYRDARCRIPAAN
jgi:hypothetical protein